MAYLFEDLVATFGGAGFYADLAYKSVLLARSLAWASSTVYLVGIPPMLTTQLSSMNLQHGDKSSKSGTTAHKFLQVGLKQIADERHKTNG